MINNKIINNKLIINSRIIFNLFNLKKHIIKNNINYNK